MTHKPYEGGHIGFYVRSRNEDGFFELGWRSDIYWVFFQPLFCTYLEYSWILRPFVAGTWHNSISDPSRYR